MILKERLLAVPMQVPQDDRDRRILGCRHRSRVVVQREVLFVRATVTVTVTVMAVGGLLLVMGCEEGV